MNDAEIRLQVKIDGSSANKEVSNLSKKTQELSNNISKKTQELSSKLSKKTQELSSKLSKKMQELSSKFTQVGEKMTLGVTAPLTALATAGVKYNASMETYLANLTTLMQGNEKEANKLLNTLKEMASTTPYETTDLVKASQKMMAFGISANDSLQYLRMIGDIAMGDANKMDSLTLAFSQISASGRASMEDINQINNYCLAV